MKLPKQIKKIMVVKLRTLGDILTTFPLVRRLKQVYPKAYLIMVADDHYKELLENNPYIDQFWPHPANQLKEQDILPGLWQQITTMAAIRREKIDLFIDLYGSLRTALWGKVSGAPLCMGFNLRGRKYFYTHRIKAAYRYVVDLNLQFIETLGYAPQDNSLEFFITSEDEEKAKNYLQKHRVQPDKPYIVVSPGGGWELKRWSAPNFGLVAKKLSLKNECKILISGNKQEEDIVKLCAKQAGLESIPVIDLPLRQLAVIIKGSKLFLGNDSGPKYIAEAFKVPTVICYGPTDYINNIPPKPEFCHTVATNKVHCQPCNLLTCPQTRPYCLADLTVEQVLELAMKVYKKETKVLLKLK